MAAPNLISANTIVGKTTGSNLTTANTTTVLNNPSDSGKCLKINTLNISNYNLATANVTLSFHNSANAGGTSFPIVSGINIPPGSTLNVIDKTSQYYLEENNSLSARSSIANTFIVTVSYEDIS
jgi:hypothetical protein